MPTQHQQRSRASLTVPRVLGYSTAFDINKDSVFTHLDLLLMDCREVVPYLHTEYPSRADVSLFPYDIVSLSNL